MNALPWIAGAILGGLGLWYSLRYDRRMRRLREDRLAKNPALTSEVFAQTFFPSPPQRTEIAARVHRIFIAIEGTSRIGLCRVHPDDGIVDDLRIEEFDSMATVEFVIALEQEFKIKLTEAQMAKARTLRDLIDHIVAQTAPAPNLTHE